MYRRTYILYGILSGISHGFSIIHLELKSGLALSLASQKGMQW